MSRSTGNLGEVLNGVEVLVKNIKRKKNLILNHLKVRKCISSDQVYRLIIALVDQILDDINPSISDQQLVNCITDRSHEVHHVNLERELKFKITELETNFQTNTETLKRTQNHCVKIQNRLFSSHEAHKNEINTLQLKINELKAKNAQMSVQIIRLEAEIKAKPNVDTVVTKIEGVKGEVYLKKEIKEDPGDDDTLIVNGTEERPIGPSIASIPGSSRRGPDEQLTTVLGNGTSASRHGSINSCLSTTFTLVNDRSGPGTGSEESEPEMSRLKHKPRVKKIKKKVILTGEKCHRCGYYNRLRNQMARHVRLCKDKPPEFYCIYCGDPYFTYVGLSHHLESRH